MIGTVRDDPPGLVLLKTQFGGTRIVDVLVGDPAAADLLSVHELGIAQQVVDVVAEASGGARVTRIVLEIGKLTAVLPDAVRFCFDLATQDTVAEGAVARDHRDARARLVPALRQRRSRSSSPSAGAPVAAPISSGSPVTSCGSKRWRWPDVRDVRLLRGIRPR